MAGALSTTHTPNVAIRRIVVGHMGKYDTLRRAGLMVWPFVKEREWMPSRACSLQRTCTCMFACACVYVCIVCDFVRLQENVNTKQVTDVLQWFRQAIDDCYWYAIYIYNIIIL